MSQSSSPMRVFLTYASIFTVLLIFATSLVAQSKDWRPVTTEELQMKSPKVDPDADAEAIFWEVRVDDSATNELALTNYVRVKIFTEKGRESFSKHDIPFTKGTRIKDVLARVTKPDGTSVLLSKDDVFEREVIRAGGNKVKVKSFALPGLEVGSIVEIKYREIVESGQAGDMRLVFQREIPIESISYYIRPFAGELGMGVFPFNMGSTHFENDKGGFSRATMTNVPAFKEEPNMLPEDEVKSWVYLFYTREMPKADEYWGKVSKSFYDAYKNNYKVTDEIKSATAEAIAGASTDEEKLHKIFDFTKSRIKNTVYADKVSDEEKKTARDAKSATDTLRLRIGTPFQIDMLFAAMARAAGYDVRVALSGDRSDMFFDPRIPSVRLMLGSSSIAVKVGSDWRFFSPASYYTPYGMLNWAEENQRALVTDPKDVIWQKTPLTPAEKSMEKRSGKFKLLEDGTLEGEARIEYTGHRATLQKMNNKGDSSAEQEKTLKDLVRSNILGTAEVSSLSIENVNDPERPFIYTFKIRVPGYASKTGKRLFFQPNVFEKSSKPQFESSTRKYDVYIHYPYSEQDEITIELPAGYSLENAEAPATIKDSQGIGSHDTQISVSNDGKLVVYKRSFAFGNNGFILFPVGSYPVLKRLFEAFNKADVHQLTIRQNAASATK